MKIIQFNAENIKRLVAVEIKPDSNLVEITGKNGQGKTSILDAILWAMGGNKIIQSKPVRDGAESGYVRLDLGDYVVTKKFKVKEDGDVTISLTVENRDGAKFGSPQELLNKFLGDLTFDPLAFSRKKPSEQVVALRALVPDYDFNAADKKAKELFDNRTDINRQVRDLKGRIDAITLPEGDLPPRISVEALTIDLQKAMEHNSKVEAEARKAEIVNRDISNLEGSIQAKRDEIAALEKAIIHNEQSIEELRDQLDGIVVEDKIDLTSIRDGLAKADHVNSIAARVEERTRLKTEMSNKETAAEALSNQIEEIKKASAAAVVAANLPIDGLMLTEDSVLLNGNPFDQASDAEQLRASVAIAGAMNPALRVIRVRDGSLLDEESMDLLREYAEKNGYQIWIETVSSGRESAVLIEEGAVVSSVVEAAE
ncbi:ATP-binding protein [Pseudochrobactrum asaccharolyticum]|uniref:AAA domain-containing protein n=1 Tax=Pseudochrobactrum asaccharolyticum TaxID=354351 RepID=A0A366DKJ5_9HYPH|nr:AAA family ATPase [Pseudochrobactrum asaccharolyticum]RBO90455.1 AAA domain-containing protein [Pseudochrobactrum asaccharolyticum]